MIAIKWENKPIGSTIHFGRLSFNFIHIEMNEMKYSLNNSEYRIANANKKTKRKKKNNLIIFIWSWALDVECLVLEAHIVIYQEPTRKQYNSLPKTQTQNDYVIYSFGCCTLYLYIVVCVT